MLKSQQIKFFTCNNPDIKCSLVERFNRTLKMRLFRYFTKQQSYKYLAALPKIVTAYNNSYHRGLKGVPANVTKMNEGKFRVYKVFVSGYKMDNALAYMFSVAALLSYTSSTLETRFALAKERECSNVDIWATGLGGVYYHQPDGDCTTHIQTQRLCWRRNCFNLLRIRTSESATP